MTFTKSNREKRNRSIGVIGPIGSKLPKSCDVMLIKDSMKNLGVENENFKKLNRNYRTLKIY